MAPISRPAVYLSRNPRCPAGIRDGPDGVLRARDLARRAGVRRREPPVTPPDPGEVGGAGAGCHETLLEEGYVTRRGGAPTAAGRQARTAGRAQRGRGPQAAGRPAAVGRAARPRAAPTTGPATVPARDRRRVGLHTGRRLGQV